MTLRSAVALAVTGMLVLVALPARAGAHGLPSPVATSYVARLGRVPAGVEAKVVNGDGGLWLRVPRDMTLVVLDPRGVPYLRFSRAGVQVNESSAMFYLNRKPLPETPPASLGPHTPAHWTRVSTADTYGWNDGRLRALARSLVAPDARYVGRWEIPIRIDGRRSAISGGVWHRGPPPLAWFWPIVVLVLCVLAAWRIDRPALDGRIARLLGVGALAAAAVADAARELYGRPTVPAFHIVELTAILTVAAWGVRRMLAGDPGYLSAFLISVLALWEGVELIPTLTHGYALTATSGFVARAATVLCLGGGLSLLLFAFRLARASSQPAGRPAAGRDDSELAVQVTAQRR